MGRILNKFVFIYLIFFFFLSQKLQSYFPLRIHLWRKKPFLLETFGKNRWWYEILMLSRWVIVKEAACQHRSRRRFRFNLCVGKIPSGGNGSPVQHSCWDNPMGIGAMGPTVRGVANSVTQLRNWALERFWHSRFSIAWQLYSIKLPLAWN